MLLASNGFSNVEMIETLPVGLIYFWDAQANRLYTSKSSVTKLGVVAFTHILNMKEAEARVFEGKFRLHRLWKNKRKKV